MKSRSLKTTLANVTGKTLKSVSHTERDRNCIPAESLLAMADYFGVTTIFGAVRLKSSIHRLTMVDLITMYINQDN